MWNLVRPSKSTVRNTGNFGDFCGNFDHAVALGGRHNDVD